MSMPWSNDESFSSELCRKELEWIAHIGCHSVIVTVPTNTTHIPKFAVHLMTVLSVMTYTRVLVRISLCSNDEDSWLKWHSLRTLCNNHPNLHGFLELDGVLPSYQSLARWNAEPIGGIYIRSRVWQRNKQGFRVLGRDVQRWIRLQRRQIFHYSVECRL